MASLAFQTPKDVVLFNAQVFKAQCTERFAALGRLDCAVALFCATVRSERIAFNQRLSYWCRDRKEAKLLYDQHPLFLNWLRSDGLRKLELGWTGCGQPLSVVDIDPTICIPSGVKNMSSLQPMTIINDDVLHQVYTSPILAINSELHKILGRMIETDRPMFLLSNGGFDDPDGDRQLWLNQLACDIIQSSGKVAVTRSMRDYWNAEDLVSLHQKLRDTSSPFDHSYSAVLNDENPDIWFQAVNRYEPVTLGGRSFRLGVNQHFEIVGQTQLATYR